MTQAFRTLLAAALLAAVPGSAMFAQPDSSAVRLHSPKKATLFSAALPGLGQVYNRKYWKVPVIYAGFAGMAYLAGVHHGRFRTYRDAYLLRTDGDPVTVDEFAGLYTDENLLTLQDFYRRNRDLSIVVLAVIYALNVVDASVDAHLYSFDVSDDLSVELRPVIGTAYLSRPAPGIGLRLRL